MAQVISRADFAIVLNVGSSSECQKMYFLSWQREISSLVYRDHSGEVIRHTLWNLQPNLFQDQSVCMYLTFMRRVSVCTGFDLALLYST